MLCQTSFQQKCGILEIEKCEGFQIFFSGLFILFVLKNHSFSVFSKSNGSKNDDLMKILYPLFTQYFPLNRWSPKFFCAPHLFFSLKILEYAPKHVLERSFLYGNYICEITQCYAKPHFSKNAESWKLKNVKASKFFSVGCLSCLY